MPSIRLIGYRQLWAHLEGQCTLEEAVRQAIVATRQYARRQLTWLRAEPGAEWFDAFDPGVHESLAERIRGFLATR
jgi:tRNA dimethylallyltransferase